MFENLKLPIVIVSSPRSGSNALLDTIQKFYTGQNINPHVTYEPLTNIYDQQSLESFNNVIETNFFITKIHAVDLITHYPKYFIDNINSKKYYLIRIRRKNIVAQIMSLYVCYLYVNEPTEPIFGNSTESNKLIEGKKVLISPNLAKKAVTDGLAHIKSCDKMNCNFDLDLWYEDLIINNKFKSEKHVKPKYPIANYFELHKIIKNILIEHNYVREIN